MKNDNNLQEIKVLFVGQQKSSKSHLIQILNTKYLYKPENRAISYIDSHKDITQKQIDDSLQADVVVLVVSAKQREFEQDFFDHDGVIKQHALIVRSGGVSNFIVAVNKMEGYMWPHQKFDFIKATLTPYLETLWQQTDIPFIPIDTVNNMNIYRPLDFSWYKGKCLYDQLQTMNLNNRKNPQPINETNARWRNIQEELYQSKQPMSTNSQFPIFYFKDTKINEFLQLRIFVLTNQQIHQNQNLTEKQKISFKKQGQTTIYKQNYQQVYLTPRKCLTFKIQNSCSVLFSQQIQKQQDFIGISCDLLLSAYKFSRKTQKYQPIKILLQNKMQLMIPIVQLINVKNHSRQLANGRGDVEGIPSYFVKQVQRIQKSYDNCKMTIFKGKQLLDHKFRLLHAVGRASIHEPVFANLTYTGDITSDKYIAFVGKGVCFDAGGLNIKRTAAMKAMYLDKQGACSVLTAFQQIVRQKLPINVTCSIGLVQNYLGPNSYRPSDIIKSRKGYTVKIDDTDAQGRLVLADAMHWTQQKYKTQVLIELSTLTYCNIKALGQKYAGMFSNNTELSDQLFKLGKNVHEHVWRMPVDIQHHEALQTPQADFMSDNSGQWIAGGSVAGAFLQKFVEQGTKWVHLDIGGVGFASEIGTGWGAILLVQYARKIAQQKSQQK